MKGESYRRKTHLGVVVVGRWSLLRGCCKCSFDCDKVKALKTCFVCLEGTHNLSIMNKFVFQTQVSLTKKMNIVKFHD